MKIDVNLVRAPNEKVLNNWGSIILNRTLEL